MLVSGVVHQTLKALYDHVKSMTVFYWRPSFWKSVASFWSPLSLGRGWRLDEKWCHPKLILQRDSPTFQVFSRLVKYDSSRFVFVSEKTLMYMILSCLNTWCIIIYYILFTLYRFPDWWNMCFIENLNCYDLGLVHAWLTRPGVSWSQVKEGCLIYIRQTFKQITIIEIVKQRRQQLTCNNIPPKKISIKTPEGADELRF